MDLGNNHEDWECKKKIHNQTVFTSGKSSQNAVLPKKKKKIKTLKWRQIKTLNLNLNKPLDLKPIYKKIEWTEEHVK